MITDVAGMMEERLRAFNKQNKRLPSRIVIFRDGVSDVSRRVSSSQTLSRAHFLAELQLRRPNMDKYRLDHLLEKKAKEGVKIYIIL